MAGLIRFAPQLAKLSLHFRSGHYGDDTVICKLLSVCEGLHYLSIQGFSLTDYFVKHYEAPEYQLNTLTLKNCYFDSQAIAWLVGASRNSLKSFGSGPHYPTQFSLVGELAPGLTDVRVRIGTNARSTQKVIDTLQLAIQAGVHRVLLQVEDEWRDTPESWAEARRLVREALEGLDEGNRAKVKVEYVD